MDTEEISSRLEAAVEKLAALEHERWAHWQRYVHSVGEWCGSAWKRDPGSGVIGVEKGPLIPVV